MRIAVKYLLNASALCLLCAGFAAPVHAETTVLDLANQANDEKIAATAPGARVLPQVNEPASAAAPALPAINNPSIPAPPVQPGAVPQPTGGMVVNTPAASNNNTAPLADTNGRVTTAPYNSTTIVAGSGAQASGSAATFGNAAAPMPTTPAAAPTPVAAPAESNAVVTLDNEERTANEHEVPEQVTKIVDKLRGAKVDLSLEDMNQARGALARLDLLLELEQKMHDLQQARAKNSGEDISGMLPANVAGSMGRRGALAGIPVATPPEPTPTPARAPRQPADISAYEIQRITGVNGHYSAVLLSTLDSKTSTARAGEKLSDGTEILAVSPTKVRLRDSESGHVRTLTIDSVSAISGGRGAQ